LFSIARHAVLLALNQSCALSSTFTRLNAQILFFFVCSNSFFLKTREAGKSGLVLFHEGVQKLGSRNLDESFELFKRAAAKGHKESIWIVSVVKDVETKKNALKEAFAKTKEPLGWYFAGLFSAYSSREQFDFFKKSVEGGCSWGQVRYGAFFRFGRAFVEKDEKAYVEWLEKAAKQNNPQGMHWLGEWFRGGGRGNDKEKAVSYYSAAAELGWKSSMEWLAKMLVQGEGCVKDLRQAVPWGARTNSEVFWWTLVRARGENVVELFDYNFDQLCYLLGWGLYWYQYDSEKWNKQDDEDRAFGSRCLDYYCSCVELQQESIFTFLLCWNRMTGIEGRVR
jgi:hypothetical protein